MSFVDHTGKVIALLDRAAEKAMTNVAMKTEGQYKRNIMTTLNTRSRVFGRAGAKGFLASHTTYEVVKRGMMSVARVGNQGVVYAAIHEFGGTIRPKRAKRLVFEVEPGQLVFAESVTIPARPTLRPAMKYAEAERDFAGAMMREMGI